MLTERSYNHDILSNDIEKKDKIVRSLKSRSEIAKGYPKRFPVPDDKASWEVPFDGYAPVAYTANNIPPAHFKPTYESYEGVVKLDNNGYPLNPMTRTGISERGCLYEKGRNDAADALVTRINPENGNFEILLVTRKNGQLAFPGGFVDPGESPVEAAGRELMEEVSPNIDFTNCPITYQGYADDPRNTDNAWIETTAIHRHLTLEEASKIDFKIQEEEVDAVDWFEVTSELLENMYANHGAIITKLIQHLLKVGDTNGN